MKDAEVVMGSPLEFVEFSLRRGGNGDKEEGDSRSIYNSYRPADVGDQARFLKDVCSHRKE